MPSKGRSGAISRRLLARLLRDRPPPPPPDDDDDEDDELESLWLSEAALFLDAANGTRYNAKWLGHHHARMRVLYMYMCVEGGGGE
jgi:hypothetical protein